MPHASAAACPVVIEEMTCLAMRPFKSDVMSLRA